MEKVKNTKGKYINKTYLWKETEKPPAAHLKKWIAVISKDVDDINPPRSINWVKWIHNFTGVSHCFSCLMLHGCWFIALNMPEQPLHERCHCSTEPIPYSQVLAEIKAKSDYSKFDPYLFNRGGKYSHNKEKLFEKWGYSIDDAKWLQTEIERQGRKNYIAGRYALGKLDPWGQRINIRIEIPRKDTGDMVCFDTGWMVNPDGKINLNTPYGGK